MESLYIYLAENYDILLGDLSKFLYIAYMQHNGKIALQYSNGILPFLFYHTFSNFE